MAAPSTALPRSAPTLPGGNEPVKLRSARPSPCHSFTKQPGEEKTGHADAPRTRPRRCCLPENEQETTASRRKRGVYTKYKINI